VGQHHAVQLEHCLRDLGTKVNGFN
jgi:hypothetical protein